MTIVQMTNRNDSSVTDNEDVWTMVSSDFESIFDQGDYSLFLLERVAADVNVPAVMLEQLLYHPAHHIRVVLAGNSGVPADSLKVLAQDPNLEVRMTLASNRQAPVEILQMLATDDCSFVSVRALGTLDRINKAAGVIQINDHRCAHKQLA